MAVFENGSKPKAGTKKTSMITRHTKTGLPKRAAINLEGKNESAIKSFLSPRCTTESIDRLRPDLFAIPSLFWILRLLGSS